MVHIATCLPKKKVMRNNKINSTEKIYDVDCVYIQYLSKIHTKITSFNCFLVDNKYFDILIATHFQELETGRITYAS